MGSHVGNASNFDFPLKTMTIFACVSVMHKVELLAVYAVTLLTVSLSFDEAAEKSVKIKSV